ncbi:DUF4252 domain-containing protein [uncultured Bacteroides sp.]|uniref:DUF4252 domain-containing protein n=1 Tax=uncultured Bacteroides sp. TaxID=162156 RepID=UPI002AAB730B|nr:DUF4252 domain-containing protein [uncultured Bacteroides sp.]
MRKRFFLTYILTLSFACCVSAQDFTTRFMTEHETDSNLSCITISPKMMEEILKSDAKKDNGILEIISNLKSMQMLTSKTKGKTYYSDALKIIKRTPNRFEPFLSFRDKSENCQIMIRKKDEGIIELVMLMHEKEHFTVINFTGNMSSDFIARIANSIKQKHS